LLTHFILAMDGSDDDDRVNDSDADYDSDTSNDSNTEVLEDIKAPLNETIIMAQVVKKSNYDIITCAACPAAID
jgi:hypothetical protein